MKLPPSLALLDYLDAFHPNMAYHLRERYSSTLEEMQKNVVSVEANLLIKKSQIKQEKKVTIKEDSSSSSYCKVDTLKNTTERIIDKMTIAYRQAKPSIKNPNYRGQQ